MKKIAKGGLGLAVGAAALYLALRSSDWAQVGRSVSGASLPYLLLGAGAFIFGMAVKGWRLLVLTGGAWKNSGIYVSAVLACLGVNSFVPLRIGEFLKIAYLAKKTSATLIETTLAVVAERVLDVIYLGLLAASLLVLERSLFLVWWAQMEPSLRSKSGTLACLLAVAAAMALLGIALWRMNFKGVRQKSMERFRRVAARFSELKKTGAKRLALSGLLTCAVWSIDTLYIWFLGEAFHLDFKLSHALFLQVVFSTSYAASVSPGALGIFEFFGLWALKSMGYAEAPSLAYLLTAHAGSFAILGLSTGGILLKEIWIFEQISKNGKDKKILQSLEQNG